MSIRSHAERLLGIGIVHEWRAERRGRIGVCTDGRHAGRIDVQYLYHVGQGESGVVGFHDDSVDDAQFWNDSIVAVHHQLDWGITG